MKDDIWQMTEPKDQILVQRALQADLESFGELCRRYYHSLVAVADQCFECQTIDSFEPLLPKPILHMQDFTMKVWIGIEEQLPIRLEAELSIGKSLMTMFNDLILHEVNVLDTYNTAIDEDTFDIVPPEGYTEITFSDILPFIPMEAKAGAASLGIIPGGLIVWRRKKRKKASACKHR